MNKVNFFIVGVCLTSIVFGMNKDVSQASPSRSIRIVGKSESADFLARRKSSSSSKESPNNSPRFSSRSRLSSSPEFPFGVIDGKVIPSQKSLAQKDKK